VEEKKRVVQKVKEKALKAIPLTSPSFNGFIHQK